VLEVDGTRMTQTFEIQEDPNFIGLPPAQGFGFGGEEEELVRIR
jgi:hypothetical protein